MSKYINNGNELFKEIRNDYYVDKSGLIKEVNKTIGKNNRLTCVSRPRRFGKTFSAQMLMAYYSKGVDSSFLFDDLEIAGSNDYKTHLNKYNVLSVDVAAFSSEAPSLTELPQFISSKIIKEISKTYPEMDSGISLIEALDYYIEKDSDGSKFIAVIDEWDMPIRDAASTPESQKAYLEFLRMLFKNINYTKKVFAAAYMTGILPVKKDGSQSPLSEFWEYSIMNPNGFAPYIGFVEDDVEKICKEYGMGIEGMREWYDGYRVYSGNEVISLYNPNSVMHAALLHKYGSYWRESSVADSLKDYINYDFDGLSVASERLLAGFDVCVDVSGFQNDFVTFKSADDVLTLLIHLGYVNYDYDRKTIRIPNNEIREEFAEMIHSVKHSDTIKRIKESERLLDDIVAMDCDAVAKAIQKVHMEESSKKYYNNEQALRAVIKLALFIYKDHYIKMEELDSGLGYADIVYLPKKYDEYPALVVELKCNDTIETGISQIKSRKYPDVIKDYGAEILLVSVSYDKDDVAKTHKCLIERSHMT